MKLKVEYLLHFELQYIKISFKYNLIQVLTSSKNVNKYYTFFKVLIFNSKKGRMFGDLVTIDCMYNSKRSKG